MRRRVEPEKLAAQRLRLIYLLIAVLLVLFFTWSIGAEFKTRVSSSQHAISSSFRSLNGSATNQRKTSGAGGTRKCGCPGVYMSRVQRDEIESSAQQIALVALPKPQRRFHSNHWFHMGEYFLSMHSHPALQAMVSTGDEIAILANEVKFVKQLTNMAAFLLVLALSPDGSAKRLQVYENSYLNIKLDEQGRKWGSFGSYGPGFSYDRSKGPTSDSIFSFPAFGARVETSGGAGKACQCGKLVDFVGRTPAPSAQWFRNAGEVNNIRAKIALLCGEMPQAPPATSSAGEIGNAKVNGDGSDGSGGSGGGGDANSTRSGTLRKESRQQRSFKMVVYQRNSNRKFQDLPLLLQELHTGLVASLSGPGGGVMWSVHTIEHKEDLQPCALRAILAEADLLLTTHGFQATALMFMRPGAVLLEVFPYKYWKSSYVQLSNQFGLHHAWTQNVAPTSMSRQILRLTSQAWCMTSNRCRTLARGDNIAMPRGHIDFVLRTARNLVAGKLPRPIPQWAGDGKAKRPKPN